MSTHRSALEQIVRLSETADRSKIDVASMLGDIARKALQDDPTVIPPVLAGDEGRDLPPHCYVERRIVANLIAHLQRAGFELHSVNDGEELIPVHDMKTAMEHVFSVDDSSLRFWKPQPGEVKAKTQRGLRNQYNGDLKHIHGVLLVCGNGVDIISDWNYASGDPDGFNAAMDAFDAERFQ